LKQVELGPCAPALPYNHVTMLTNGLSRDRIALSVRSAILGTSRPQPAIRRASCGRASPFSRGDVRRSSSRLRWRSDNQVPHPEAFRTLPPFTPAARGRPVPDPSASCRPFEGRFSTAVKSGRCRETDPRPRVSSVKRAKRLPWPRESGRGSSPYQGDGTRQPRLSTRFVIGEENNIPGPKLRRVATPPLVRHASSFM